MCDTSVEVACTLGGDDLASQQERWAKLRAGAELERTDTADGLRIRFRGDQAVERELHALTAIENECCSWAQWRVETANGDVTLAVSSTGEGVNAAQALLPDRAGQSL
jgi:hypothetical protein